jgi:membrane-bound inhibitor of C-type lysozyme
VTGIARRSPQSYRHVGAWLAAAALGGCISVTETTVIGDSGRLSYVCPGGKAFDVVLAPNPPTATLMLDGKQILLQRVAAPEALGVRYSDGRTTFNASENRAVVAVDSFIALRDCFLRQ